ncbi:MAG: DNA primase [Clostridiaceae bacterium]|nr:DNA primase [Clostridiaceae bacterium]
MALPQSFLDELIYRCDIVEVISRYVSLKKSGSGYVGLCPFHNEKTPSFSVSGEKQFFHCFGCGEGGNVISFIMKEENLPFLDAVKLLADMYGMTVPEDEGGNDEERRLRERILSINKEAARFYHGCLLSEEGRKALEYLLARGLTKKTITDFGLGYALTDWDRLCSEMLKKGYTKYEIESAWIGRKNRSGGLYDAFRDRVMFPIIDIRGNVIAFGGRIIEGDGPKYLNSGDTPVFNKSRNLFALNFAKKSKTGRLILAEGYMDVISLHQAGFDCAVASLGTALTTEQARLMGRYAKKVIISYDSDSAGQKASQKAIDLLNRAGLEVKVLRIPGAKDPDEFIKKNGSEAFALLLDKPQSDSEYRLSVMKAKYVLDIDAQKIEYLKEAADYIATVSSPVEREILSHMVAQEAGISAGVMAAEVKRAFGAVIRKEKKKTELDAMRPLKMAQRKETGVRYENPRSAVCEEKLLSIILEDADLLKSAEKLISPDEFSSPFLAKIYEKALEMEHSGHDIIPAAVMSGLDEGEARCLTSILSAKVLSQNEKKELEDYIKVIKEEKTKNTSDFDQKLIEVLHRKRERKG